MRFTVLTYEYRPFVGGIGTYVAELCRALHRAGHEVVLIAPDYVRTDAPTTEVESFPVRRFPSGRSLGSWAQWFRNARVVGSMIREAGGTPVGLSEQSLGPGQQHQFVLLLDLHAFMLVGAMGIVCRGVVRMDRTAAVFHGSEIRYLQTGRRARLLGRPVVDRTPFLFTNSEWTRSLLESGGETSWHRRASVAGIGVSPRLAEAPRDGEKVDQWRERLQLGARHVLLTVARLVPRKGIDRSLRAFAELPPDLRASWVYLIAGDGTERNALETLSRELSIDADVRWLGPVIDGELPVLYDLAALYVQLSRDVAGEVEGLGITFLEAGVRGLPCLACRHGGIPEAIVDGETGLLVPADDSAAARDALVRLMTDAALRSRLGAAAKERVEREFRWDRVAERVASRLGG
jgi:glycosyltransferase involved in cell wall biosynthesis